MSSKKRFHVGKQSESFEFLSWLLNELHRVRIPFSSVSLLREMTRPLTSSVDYKQGLGGSSKPGSSIIHKCFQGFVEVTTVDEAKVALTGASEEESAVTTVTPCL